jgi:hypothetical protein
MALLIAKGVVEKVGIDLGLKLISGASTSAKNISALMGFIQSESNEDKLVMLLKNTDVELTVKILECIISEINVNKKTPNSVINCLKGLHDILNKIENELHIIKLRIEYNKSLYVFKSLRSYNFSSNINKIKNCLSILDNRKKLLFETIEISHSLVKGHINQSILEGSLIFNKQNKERFNKLALDKSFNTHINKIDRYEEEKYNIKEGKKDYESFNVKTNKLSQTCYL